VYEYCHSLPQLNDTVVCKPHIGTKYQGVDIRTVYAINIWTLYRTSRNEWSTTSSHPSIVPGTACENKIPAARVLTLRIDATPQWPSGTLASRKSASHCLADQQGFGVGMPLPKIERAFWS